MPVNILIPKGVKLRRHGARAWSPATAGTRSTFNPASAPRLRILFDRGMVVAIANLRGGGEYGEEWHNAGRLTRKQNVFDDFAAACRYMIDHKYTSSNRLAIEGGSNGGLLMGATLTQHPGLMHVVVTHVGIYDMLRVELSSNGAFNVPEFGTVKDPEQFKALYAYSPYHHVKDGVKYPATLVPDRSERPPRRSLAIAQDGCSAAGGDGGQCADSLADERIDRPWARYGTVRACRGIDRRLFVPVCPVGNRGQGMSSLRNRRKPRRFCFEGRREAGPFPPFEAEFSTKRIEASRLRDLNPGPQLYESCALPLS